MTQHLKRESWILQISFWPWRQAIVLMAKRQCRTMALVIVHLSSPQTCPSLSSAGRANLPYDQCSPCWLSTALRVLQYHQLALTAGEKEGPVAAKIYFFLYLMFRKYSYSFTLFLLVLCPHLGYLLPHWIQMISSQNMWRRDWQFSGVYHNCLCAQLRWDYSLPDGRLKDVKTWWQSQSVTSQLVMHHLHLLDAKRPQERPAEFRVAGTWRQCPTV